ncbi:MAG: membrane protein YqaA with SNARE-associated domain [Candidatus Paceibacteria bacterium]|jgi:membrane protein YqaA with SNARE-associated domain
MVEPTTLDTHVEKVLNTRTVTRAQKLMGSQSGLWLVGGISFIESLLPVPIITDPFMVACILANRSRAAVVVFITLITSVLGGICAFLMARYFFGLLESLMTSGMLEQFQNLIAMDSSNTLLLTLVGAMTPIPYTITAWVVAVGEGSLILFITASVIGRGFRYGVVGLCTYWFGSRALTYARRSLGVTTVVLLLLVALYVWLKL